MMKKRSLPLFFGGLFTIISCLGCSTGVNAIERITWPEFPVSSEVESERASSSETETDALNSDWHRLSDSELDQLFGDLPRYLDLGSFTLNQLNNIPIPQITPDGMIIRDRFGHAYRIRITWNALEDKITSMLSGYQGDWSVYLKDLKNGNTMEINEHAMQSASLIKLYIAGATLELIENGDLIETDTITHALHEIITVSDNESCNELGRLQSDTYDFIDGAKQVNKYLKKEGYTKTSYQSTLHPSASKLITLGGHNQTTVTDCGKLLERIYRGECVSKEASEEMLDLLKNQQNTSKIPEGLGVDVPTANKTGETDEDQHDIAIVYGTKTTYILCVMSENASNAIANIRNISRVVYNYLNL